VDIPGNRPIEMRHAMRTPQQQQQRRTKSSIQSKSAKRRSVRWSDVLTSDLPLRPTNLKVPVRSVLKRTSNSLKHFDTQKKRRTTFSSKETYRERWHANALRSSDIYIDKLPEAIDVFRNKIVKCAASLQRYGYIWDAIELRRKLEAALRSFESRDSRQNDDDDLNMFSDDSMSDVLPDLTLVPNEEEKEKKDVKPLRTGLSFKDFHFDSKQEKNTTLIEIFEEKRVDALSDEAPSPVPKIGEPASLHMSGGRTEVPMPVFMPVDVPIIIPMDEESHNKNTAEDVETIVVNVRVTGESGDFMAVDVCDASLCREEDKSIDDGERIEVELRVVSEGMSDDLVLDVRVAGECYDHLHDDVTVDDVLMDVVDTADFDVSLDNGNDGDHRHDDDKRIISVVREYIDDMIDFLEHDIRWREKMKHVEESSSGSSSSSNEIDDADVTSGEMESSESGNLLLVEIDSSSVDNEEEELHVVMDEEEDDMETSSTPPPPPPRDLRRHRLCSLQQLIFPKESAPPQNEIWVSSFDNACAKRRVAEDEEDLPICSLQSLGVTSLTSEEPPSTPSP